MARDEKALDIPSGYHLAEVVLTVGSSKSTCWNWRWGDRLCSSCLVCGSLQPLCERRFPGYRIFHGKTASLYILDLADRNKNIGGLALAYWIEYFAYLNHNKSMAWRAPLALQIIFIIIIGIGINFFPESPRWLMKVGREEEAQNVLKATREGDVQHELKEIKKVVKFELETSTANHYWAMLFPKDKYSRGLRWRVFLAVWLQIMQELVGIGVITVYAVTLFEDAGFGEELSKLLAGFNNLSYMFSVIFAVFTLDRFGRRGKSYHHIHYQDKRQLT